MFRARAATILFATTLLFAQAPEVPQLAKGEALVTMDSDNKFKSLGDATTAHPLGELSKLLWVKIAGADYSSLDVYWDCKNPLCKPPKGHGRVDYKKAFREDCDEAFLYWASWERKEWVEQQGDGITRMQVMSAFGPFLGDRVPKEGPLMEFTPEWIGRGDLLQATPEGLLRWAGDPDNQGVMTTCREFLKGYLAVTWDMGGWWFKPGVCSQGTWVLAGNGKSAALLFIPMPETPKDAILRMKTLMGMKK